MKFKSLLLTLLLAVSFGAIMPRQAEARVTFSFFYDSLQPYGDWIDVQNYGYCWQPRGVDGDWRPYTDGYWTYTDAGWTWVSYEDFGSITYHYGRWIRLEEIGWVWRPDYRWGPAWVSWRKSDDYIGWAPLPPEADFNEDNGIGVWVDRDYDIGPSAYSFCEYRYFGAPVVRNYILPRRRNVVIINSTVNITNITFVSGGGGSRFVFNGGLDYRRMAERSEHRIDMLQLMRQTDGDWAHHHRSELSRRVGNQLYMNAPEIEVPQHRYAPSKVAREVRGPRIDKGWMGVSDPSERERIQQRYHDQTRGAARGAAPVDMNQVHSMMNEARERQEQVRAQQEMAVQQAKAQQKVQKQVMEAAQHQAEVVRDQQQHALKQQVKAQERIQDQAKEVAQRQAEAIRAQQELAQRQAQAEQKAQRQVQEAAKRQAEAARDQQQELAQRQAQAQQNAQRQVQDAAKRQAEVIRNQQEQVQKQAQAQAKAQQQAQVMAQRQAQAQARAQQEMAQRQAQAEMKTQRQAQEMAQRIQQAQQAQQRQAQPGASPDNDQKKKKKHKDD